MTQNRKDPHLDAGVIEQTRDRAAEFTRLPLASLVESPANPRRRLEPRGIEELAENVRRRGVLVPLIVWRCNGPADQYRILAGHRRYRSAPSWTTNAKPKRRKRSGTRRRNRARKKALEAD